MKKITLLLFVFFTCWQISAQTGTIVVGVNDGIPNTATGDPSPLQDYWKVQRTQYLYTAQELTGAGLVAGNITSIGWVATALNLSGLQENYTIKIKSTSSTVLTTTFETGATEVYSPTDFTPTSTGNVMFTLTTPFNWNGTSNIIVELCAGLASGTYTENVSCSNSTTVGNMTAYFRNDSETAPCTIATAGTLTNQRPLLVISGNVAGCLAPLNVVAGAITATTAAISWDAAVPTPSLGYEYVISTTNVVPTGTGTATTATFASLTSLLPQTQYYIFIRSKCDAITYSGWNGPILFKTACANVTAFNENFDGVATSTFPSCWAKVGTSGYAYLQTGSTSSAPNTLYMVSYGSATTSQAVVSAQLVSNLGAGTNRIKFNMACYTVGGVVEFGYLTDPLDASTFVPLTSFTAATVGYSSYQFSPPAGTYSDFPAFRHTGVSTNSVLIDNVVWEAIPACLDATGLVAAGITATAASVSWDALTGVTAYQYAVTTSATPPVSGTSTTLTFASVSGLTPQTVYYLHVRAACTGGTFGLWSTLTFTSACAPIAPPVLETFDTFLPNQCWFKGDNGDLTAGPATFGTNGWKNDGFGNIGTTGSIAYNHYYTGANDWIISPQIAIPVTGYELKFDAALTQWNGTTAPTTAWDSGDVMEVLVSTTGFTNWTVLYSISNANPPANTGSPIIVDLDAYAAQNIRIAYRVVSGPTDGADDTDIFVDNFQIRLTPSCVEPVNLVSSGYSATTASISWDATSPAPTVGYQYIVSTSNATPTTAGTATTSTFAALTGLLPQTTYYVFVRSDCGTGSFSYWTGPISFTTLCTPVSVLPWTEGFEGVTTPALPTCWFKQNGNYATSSDVTYNNAHAGTKYLRTRYGASNEFVWTPGFNLTAGISYDFSSFVQGDNGTTWEVSYFVNNAQSSTGATQLGGTYTVPGSGFPYAPQSYNTLTRSFVPATTGTYYFAVKVNEPTSGPWYVAFDDFELKLSPACPTPSASATAVTDATATVSWSAVPSATLGYEYVLNTTAADPSVAGTSTTSLTYAATGLTQTTVYYFHIRSVCAAGTYSTWSTTSFTTLATPPVNDNCANAIAVVAGGTYATNPVNGSNVGATTSAQTAPTTCFGYSGGDIWYTTTVPTSGNITIETGTNTGGTGLDTVIAVYTGTCGALTQVGCDDDGATESTYGLSLLSLTGLTPGATLYIRAYEYGNDTFGSFKISAYDASLGTNSFNNNAFTVYPNPVKNILNINYTENITKIQIVNMLGQEIITKTVNTTQNQVDMTGLVQGTYLVKITSNEMVKTIKVIKE